MTTIHLHSRRPVLFLAFGRAAFCLVAFCSLACPPASGKVVVRHGSGDAVTVQTDSLRAEWSADGALVVRAGPDMAPVVSREASLQAGQEGEDARAWPRESVRVSQENETVTVEEVFRDPGGSARIHVASVFSGGRPFFSVDLSAENLEAEGRRITVAYALPFTKDYGTADKVLGFLHKKDLDTGLIFDLPGETVVTQWGVGMLSWRPEGKGQRLNLPILCPFRSSAPGGPVVFSENRVSLGWEAGPERIAVFKRFYLRPGAGDRDDGIDLRDGDGKLPYRFYLGYAEQPTWDKLYVDYYLEAFPHLRGFEPAGRTALQPGSITGTGGVFDQTPLALEWKDAGTQAAASSGASYFMVWYQHGDRTLQEKTNLGKEGVALTTAAGMVPLLWDNVKIAPENNPGSAVKYWGEEFSHRHFRDSWFTNAAGEAPHKSWEGYACNQSPDLSFARAELESIKKQFAEFGYAGLFLDYYGSGAGVDYIRGYDDGRYPFYPDQVSLTDYTRQLTEWLHQNGHIFVANVPDECLGVLRFSDYYFGDIGAEWGRIYKITIGARPFVVTGLTSTKTGLLEQQKDMLCKALAFGYLTSVGGWAQSGWSYTGLTTEPERSQVLNLNGSNSRFMFDISSSLLVGGVLGKQHLFLSPSGRAFATALNESDAPRDVHIPLDSPRLKLNKSSRYTVFEWDISTGATMRLADASFADVSKGLNIHLEPGSAKALVVLPAGQKIVLPYLAAFPGEGIHTMHSTGRIAGTTFREDGGRRLFAVSVDAPWGRSLTTIRVPEGVTPDIAVLGALDYRKSQEGNVVRLEVTHHPGSSGGASNALQPVVADAGVSSDSSRTVATVTLSWAE